MKMSKPAAKHAKSNSSHRATGVKKYRVPQDRATYVLNDMVCTSAFCQGNALLRVYLWKGDSLLWGTANILTPVQSCVKETL